jgi:hypothetical protein
VEATIEQRAPMVRCYKCGSSQVSALCHHCRRPGCAKHVLPLPRWTERLFGTEGGGPGLENVRACHCGDCAHIRVGTAGTTSRPLAIGVAGTGLAMIGLITVWLSLIAGLILLLAGGISATWACLRIRHGAVQVRRGMPVPLHPKVADVQLTEQLRGEINLGTDRNDYQTDLEPVEGKVSMTLTFGRPDRDRVRRRRKHLHTPDAEVRYCAGLLVLQGPSGIKVDEQVGGPVLPLDGNTRDYPVFRAEDAPSSSRWNFARQYQLRTKPKIKSGPVWITPSIVPESDRHALELDIQWVEFGPDEKKPLSLDVIELLRLEFPVDWGEIHSWGIPQGLSALTRAVSGLTPEGRRSLELKRLRPGKQAEEGQEFRATRLTLSIRFAGQVNREDEISGRLKATMRGTLSGITGVQLFNSLGAGRGYAGTASITTRLDTNFRLSLASIRYQDIRVVPDRAAEDSDRDSYASEFAVVPGDETVIALTNAISEEGYYVKHVIENPPRSGKRADLVQRYWDIAGRRYEGVYPIDFHIILTGEEVHSGDIRPERGTTKVRIVVKGAYTDDEMDTRICDEWKQLRELTEETLGRQDSAGTEPG